MTKEDVISDRMHEDLAKIRKIDGIYARVVKYKKNNPKAPPGIYVMEIDETKGTARVQLYDKGEIGIATVQVECSGDDYTDTLLELLELDQAEKASTLIDPYELMTPELRSHYDSLDAFRHLHSGASIDGLVEVNGYAPGAHVIGNGEGLKALLVGADQAVECTFDCYPGAIAKMEETLMNYSRAMKEV